MAEITLKSMSRTFWIQVLPNKISSNPAHQARSFQQPQRHIPIPLKVSTTIYFNFQWNKSSIFKECLNHKSKHHGTMPMHPSSSRAFQRHQEHNLKHPGSLDLITTKQNKLPSFIDRWASNGWCTCGVLCHYGPCKWLEAMWSGFGFWLVPVLVLFGLGT